MFYVEASIGIIASDIRCAFSRSVWKGLNSSLTAPHARPDQHELCLWIWCLIISYFEGLEEVVCPTGHSLILCILAVQSRLQTKGRGQMLHTHIDIFFSPRQHVFCANIFSNVNYSCDQS